MGPILNCLKQRLIELTVESSFQLVKFRRSWWYTLIKWKLLKRNGMVWIIASSLNPCWNSIFMVTRWRDGDLRLGVIMWGLPPHVETGTLRRVLSKYPSFFPLLCEDTVCRPEKWPHHLSLASNLPDPWSGASQPPDLWEAHLFAC